MNHSRDNGCSAKLRIVRLVPLALGIALAFPAGALAQRGGTDTEVLTNQAVINMVTAKLNKDLLTTKINSTRNSFDVTVNGLVSLQQSKVPPDAIRSMITMAADAKLGRPPSRTPEVLQNQSVVTLVTAKVPKAVVLAKIQSTRSAFDVSADGLVGLTKAKVPTDVIKAMIAKDGGTR